MNTMEIENKYHLSFCTKLPLSIERGEGVYVWDENGKKYLDFTAGWAVSSVGNCHPVINSALTEQCVKIMHNPNSGLTYSPARAKLLLSMQKVLPEGLIKIFFTNSGAEANDAAMKLARKVTGRKEIVSTGMSFHGRTIGTASATGQSVQRDRFNVLLPHHVTVPYNDVAAMEKAIGAETAAVIVEPIQGEGGIIVPDKDYLAKVSSLCKAAGALLILDEIQTGFFRTGDAFEAVSQGVTPDILTMAKGIAGGFPLGAVAVSDAVAAKTEQGDHGGTYIGNPLGCAVASAVIDYMVESDIGTHVKQIGEVLSKVLEDYKSQYPELIQDIRGKGLLWAVELKSQDLSSRVFDDCLDKGLILNLKHGKVFRFFPALTITEEELMEGAGIFFSSMQKFTQITPL